MLSTRGLKLEAALGFAAKFGAGEVLKTIEEVETENLTPTVRARLKTVKTGIEARLRPGNAVGNARTVQEALPAFMAGQKTVFSGAYVSVGGAKAPIDLETGIKIGRIRRGLDASGKTDSGMHALHQEYRDLTRQLNAAGTESREAATIRTQLRSVSHKLDILTRQQFESVMGKAPFRSVDTEQALRRTARVRRRNAADDLDPNSFAASVFKRTEKLILKFEERGYVDPEREMPKFFIDDDDMREAFRIHALFTAARDGGPDSAREKLDELIAQDRRGTLRRVSNVEALTTYDPERTRGEYSNLGLHRTREMDPTIERRRTYAMRTRLSMAQAGVIDMKPDEMHELEREIGHRLAGPTHSGERVFDNFGVEGAWNLGDHDDETDYFSDEIHQSDIWHHENIIRESQKTRVEVSVDHRGNLNANGLNSEAATEVARLIEARANAGMNRRVHRLIDERIRQLERKYKISIKASINRQADKMAGSGARLFKAAYLDMMEGTEAFDGTVRLGAGHKVASYLQGKRVRYLGSSFTPSGEVHARVAVPFVSSDTIQLRSARDIVHEYVKVLQTTEDVRKIERKALLHELSIVKQQAEMVDQRVFGGAAQLVTYTSVDKRGRNKVVAAVFKGGHDGVNAFGQTVDEWLKSKGAKGGDLEGPRKYRTKSGQVRNVGVHRVTMNPRQARLEMIELQATINDPNSTSLMKRSAEAQLNALFQLYGTTGRGARTIFAKQMTGVDKNLRPVLRDFLLSAEFIESSSDPAQLQEAVVRYVRRMKSTGKGGDDMVDALFRGVRQLSTRLTGKSRTAESVVLGMAGTVVRDEAERLADRRKPLTYRGGVADVMGDAFKAINDVREKNQYRLSHGRVDGIHEQLVERLKAVLEKHGVDEHSDVYDMFRRSLFDDNTRSDSVDSLFKAAAVLSSKQYDMAIDSMPEVLAGQFYGKKFDDLLPSQQDRINRYSRAMLEAQKFKVDALLEDADGNAFDIVRRSSLSEMFGEMARILDGHAYQDHDSAKRLDEMLKAFGISARHTIEDIARIDSGTNNVMGTLTRAAKNLAVYYEKKPGEPGDERGSLLAGFVSNYLEDQNVVDKGESLDEIIDKAIKREFGDSNPESRRRALEEREGFIRQLHMEVFGSEGVGSGSIDEMLLSEKGRRESQYLMDFQEGVVGRLMDPDGDEEEVDLVGNWINKHIDDKSVDGLSRRYVEHLDQVRVAEKAAERTRSRIDSLRANLHQAPDRAYAERMIAKLEQYHETLTRGIGLHREAANDIYEIAAGYGRGTDFIDTVEALKASNEDTWEFSTELSQMIDDSLARSGNTFTVGGEATVQGFFDSLTDAPMTMNMRKFNGVLNDTIMPAFRDSDPVTARQALSRVFGEGVEVHIGMADIQHADNKLKSKKVMILKDTNAPDSPLTVFGLSESRSGGKTRYSVSKMNLEDAHIVDIVDIGDVASTQNKLATGSTEILNKVLTQAGKNKNDLRRALVSIYGEEMIPETISNDSLIDALKEYGTITTPEDYTPDQALDLRTRAMLGSERRGLLDHITTYVTDGAENKDFELATRGMTDMDELLYQIQHANARSMRTDRNWEEAAAAATEDMTTAFSKLFKSENLGDFADQLAGWASRPSVQKGVIIGGSIMAIAAAKRIHDTRQTTMNQMLADAESPGSKAVVRVASNEDGYAGTVSSRRQPYGAVQPHGPMSMSSSSSTISLRDNLRNITARDIDDMIS
jgi:N-glycosylase/DNA lyase